MAKTVIPDKYIDVGVFGDSLVKNGAGEFGDLQLWTGVSKNGTYKGMDVLALTGGFANSSYKFYIDINYLYKIEAWVRTDATYAAIGCISYSSSGVQLSKTVSVGAYGISLPTNSSFQQYTGYIGGQLNNLSSFPVDAVKATAIVSLGNGTYCEFAKLVIRRCELGEAVPHNLAYLPLGQMVYHVSTGVVGRYDGTEISWLNKKNFYKVSITIAASGSVTITHSLDLVVAENVIVNLIRPDGIGVSDYVITSYAANSFVITIPSYYPTGTYTVRVLTGFSE